jgi:hypothetical protein
MAATLQGAFEIVDRASNDLRRMRREALLTDAAFKKLGVTMDVIGSRQKAQGIERTARATRGLGQEAERAARSQDLLGRRSRDNDRHLRTFGDRVGRVTRGLREFGGELFRLAKPGGMLVLMGTAVGVLGQAVVQLGGGLVALAPRLADLTGLLAPAIAGLTGFGAAAITAMTAFGRLQAAMKGGPGALGALRDIGRPGAQLVADLRAARAELRQFRQAASGGIFTGVRQALAQVRGAVPQLLPIVRQYSSMLGGLAAEAGRRATSPQALGDLRNILGQGRGITQDMGRGLMNLASALRHVAVAAEPFTEWLSKIVLGWTEFLKQSAETGRASGRLSRFFERTQTAAEGLGRVVRDLWVTLRNVGRAARPLGESLYRSIERTTASWARITGTPDMRLRLIRDFNSMEAGLKAMASLAGTLGGALWRLGTSRGLAQVAESLEKAVPPLERLLTVMAEAFGPSLARSITNIATLLENLTGATGPVVTLVDGLNAILEGINGILRLAGPFKGLIGTLVGGFLTARFLTKIGALTFAWRGVTAAATQAAVAQAAAMGGGAAAAGRAGATAAAAGGFGLGPLFGGGRGPGRGARGWLGRFGRGRMGAPLAPGALGPVSPGRAAMLGGLGGGLLRGAGAVAGRFVLPIMALQGLFAAGTAYGGFGNRAYAGVNAATGGLLGAAFGGPRVSPEEMAGRAAGRGERALTAELAGIRGGTELDRLNRQIVVLRGHMQAFGRQNTEAGRNYRQQLQAEIEARQQLVGQMTAEAQMRGQERGGRLVGELNRVYQRAGGGAAGIAAATRLLPESFQAAGGRGPRGMAARRTIGRSALAGAWQLARRDPSLMPQYRALEMAVEAGTGGIGRAGQLFIGGRQERGQIMEDITMPLELRQARARGQLTPTELDMVASLEASGMPRAVALSIMRTHSGNPRGLRRAIAEWFRSRREPARRREQQRARRRYGELYADPERGPVTTVPTPRAARMPAIPGVGAAIRGLERLSGAGLGGAAGAARSGASRVAEAVGGWFGQGGGRLPGTGLRDTVPVAGGMAAPGEMVVNRHTERRVNAMLARHGKTLEGLTDDETRGHAQAPVPARDGILPGLQVGGRLFYLGSRAGGGPSREGPAGTGANQRARGGGGVGRNAVLSEANRISALNSRYRYGGGHVTPAPADPPWDCSSSVSRLLQVGGLNVPTMVSGDMQNIGESGPGWFTIYANPGHVYAMIGGRAWGTSRSRPGGGPGWFQGGARQGFTVRHIPAFGGGRPGGGGGAGADGGGGQPQDPRARYKAWSVEGITAGGKGLFGLGGLKFASGVTEDGGGTGGQRRRRQNPPTGGGGGGGGSNRALGKRMMLAAGWAANEWPALNTLWTGESGWRTTADNPSSDAYGIPQALPGSKMASAGADWKTNPATQIKWGLNYIRGRYGSPTNALEWWNSRSPHWYSGGGRTPRWGGWHQMGLDRTFSSPTVIGVGEKGAERVTVTPKGRGSGGTVTISPTFNINGGDPGRVQQEVERALTTFAGQLERMGLAGEEGGD